MAPPLPDVVWPEPPDLPRIKYLTSYRGATFSRNSVAADILLGKESKGLLKKPMGVYVDPDGKVYVTDTAAADVFIIDPVNKTGTTASELGANIFFKPIGVGTDSKGRLYVTDSQSDNVTILDPKTGKVLGHLAPDEPFEQPTGLVVDRPRHRVFVTDTHTHQIKIFDTETFKQIGSIGKRGKEEGEFNFPSHITVDKDGKLYVVDTMNGRVQIFDAEGKFLRTFGEFGDAPGMFARPKGVGVDSEGHIYVVDSAFNNVQIFDQEGHTLMAFASYGNDRGQMILPAGLAVDKDDNIYVVDSWNRRVEVFEFLGKKYYKRNNIPLPEGYEVPVE
ncbi:MAG: 6-bladed beta-propeller [Thermodesulfobacteriota bacterium]